MPPGRSGINPVLQKIIDTKKEEISRTPVYSNLPLATLSLSESLKSKPLSIIAECKKGSPSAGIIRENYDPVGIAEIYEQEGARAISVLTDEKYFHGSLSHLEKVSSAVSIPCIRKDFIIHERQIFEARKFGASAILLIVRILDVSQLKDLMNVAHSLNMDCLVETHTQEEAETAIEAGAKIIGINTRDLDTFRNS